MSFLSIAQGRKAIHTTKTRLIKHGQGQQNLVECVDNLLLWARKNGRRPPWRQNNDPFKIAVAEILLQKTKAADIEVVWEQLTARFPTNLDMVNATDGEILDLVGSLGLGHQRTSRLKAMATAWSGSYPEIDGIGGLGSWGKAIVCWTMGRDSRATPIDGNVTRFVTRYFGFQFEKGEPRKKPEVANAVRQLLSGQETPADKLRLIYALVDLGYEICKPVKPNCRACPVSRGCIFQSSL